MKKHLRKWSDLLSLNFSDQGSNNKVKTDFISIKWNKGRGRRSGELNDVGKKSLNF